MLRVQYPFLFGTILCLGLIIGVGHWSSAQQPAKPTTPEAAAFFETKVRPILVAKCFSCHSAESKPVQGGLKLDTREGLLKGGVQGTSLIPGDAEHSMLIRAVLHTDKNLQMPPGSKLKPDEIAALTAWVKMGAPWPENVKTPKNTSPTRKPFWAYIPPKQPPLPKAKNLKWAQNPIDRFILAGLEAKGLAPAPPTDRRTLIRRATYDLIGLPPTPKEIQDFLKDSKPGAFARVVDRLLASPAYGERWGRHWLDVARYADSNGVDENLVYTQAWRYRDYVVRAFNQDKPINRFIQEQIAGDLLPSSDDETADFDRVTATGYLSLGPKMLAEDDPVKQELDIIDEQIDTLGKTFMGMTLGCARCHDHKFDPITQADYYALAGIFKSTKTMMNFRNMAEWQEVPLASKAAQEQLKAVEKEIGEKRGLAEKQRKTAGEALIAEAKRNAEKYRTTALEFLRGESAGAVLRPVISKAEEPLPTGAIAVEAEDFVRGNVLKDKDGFGKGIGVLVNAGKYPNVTEYEVSVSEAGPYQLDLRYASNDPRPIRIVINGALVTSNAAGKLTGGFNPDTQQWFAEGVFLLRAGKNLIKFERDSYFPHIDKFLLISRKGQPITRTAEQIAEEAGLIPDFLAQTVEQIRKDKEVPASALNFALPEKPDRLYVVATQEEIKKLDAEIAALEKRKPMLPRAMAVSEGKPTTLKVHLRGNYLTLGQECVRRFPTVLAGEKQPPIADTHSGRLELAQWMTRNDHPLTSRVFVNRVWRWHFGKGIVGSTDNFGTLGDKPINPALLDYLATSFASDGWSLKKLHRRILLSNTYQMSSRYDAKAAKADPENRLHWRMERKRLEAEAIRDAVLAVSGQLDRTIGGTLLTFRDREYVTSTANSDPVNYRSTRRSLYLPVVRSALYDVYTAFDFGDPTVMNGDRPTTTVAPQALFMMNSALVLEQTKVMATALLALQDSDDVKRIQVAYETCYGRPASAKEVTRALDYLRRLDDAYVSAEPDATKRRVRAYQSLCKSLLAANEFIYIE